MANKRTYWAIQALGTHVSDGSFTVATAKFVPGVQSVGITTNYNLEQTFQLGQLEIYQDIEEVPDIEISVEKVLDQTTARYGRVMDPADPTKVEIVADQNNQVDVVFAVHPDTDKTAGEFEDVLDLGQKLLENQKNVFSEGVNVLDIEKKLAQARKDGNASPLGMIYDHGLDSINGWLCTIPVA